jgi:hypothetical protein
MRQRRSEAARFADDPESGSVAEVRTIQPYQALKSYLCPGCNQEIRPGTGHLVVVPLSDAGARRHWHRACFEQRGLRRPGRR